MLEFGLLEGVEVMVLRGRIHLYEGYSAEEVVYPIRVLAQFGAKTVILTSAAGGINEKLHVGNLMIITDHINFTGTSPLIGKKTGTRFLDMGNAYKLGTYKKII